MHVHASMCMHSFIIHIFNSCACKYVYAFVYYDSFNTRNFMCENATFIHINTYKHMYTSRGEMYVTGVDREGRPSWTWRCSLHDASLSTPELGARYLVCTLERTWRVNPMAEKMVVMCDCGNLKYNNYEHQVCLNLCSVYPGCLCMCSSFHVYRFRI